MAANNIYKRLLMASESEAEYAIRSGFHDYSIRLYLIANDIYNSCIEEYYSSYDPIRYKRHGKKEGFNLYRPNEIYYFDNNFEIYFNEDDLFRYYGKNGESIKKKVLDNVMSGLRGTGGMREWQTDWPRKWYTRYPNAYSEYNDWFSSEHTIDDIFKDFVKNIMSDTKDLRDEFISKYI
jgi:hypothetical protein